MDRLKQEFLKKAQSYSNNLNEQQAYLKGIHFMCSTINNYTKILYMEEFAEKMELYGNIAYENMDLETLIQDNKI